MRRIYLAFLLTILISGATYADDLLLAEGIQNTNYHASVAHSVKGRTIVYVWEHVNEDNTFRDIRMLVVEYNKKGVFSANKVKVISGLQHAVYPRVAYNPESRRFLVVWQFYQKSYSSVFGRLLTKKGVPVGEEFPISSEAFKSFRWPSVVPLLKGAHNGTNKGDFLISTYSSAAISDISLVQFNSKSRKLFTHNTDSWTKFIPQNLAVAESGQVLLTGTSGDRPFKSAILSFKLNDAKATYFKVADSPERSTLFHLAKLTPNLFYASWAEYDGSDNVYKYRLVRASGKPRGGVKINKAIKSYADGNYLMASNGSFYNTTRPSDRDEILLNRYSSRGKFKEAEAIVKDSNFSSEDQIIVEIEELGLLLIFYKSFDHIGMTINGHLYSIED